MSGLTVCGVSVSDSALNCEGLLSWASMNGLAMLRSHCVIGDCFSALSRLAFSRSQLNEFSMTSVPLMPNVWRSSALMSHGTRPTERDKKEEALVQGHQPFVAVHGDLQFFETVQPHARS